MLWDFWCSDCTGIIFISHGYPSWRIARRGADGGIFCGARAADIFVYIAGVIETFGGGLLLIGLFTRPRRCCWQSRCAWRSGRYKAGMAIWRERLSISVTLDCRVFALATIGAE